ncbi:MAG TPA: GFA family protein [Burkholderiales bacterium]|nr:GFA family protein [Burkholderiales bacterium]
MQYKGSCHCGHIAFQAEGEIKEVLACNCSMCQRKGSLLWFIPRNKFTLLTPERELSTYTFNKHFIKHRFCPKCGIHPFAEASDKSGKPMAAINVRCVQGVEPTSFPVKEFNGRAI